MLRSLFSGISGLRSHQTMMDVTGNNIANVNTVGYKSSQTQFQDTLSQVVQSAGAPTGERGGTNPAQVGLGVRLAGITTNFGQGAAQLTGRSTDLMISGDGFFVVNNGGQQMFTRAGSMSFDAQGRLVTPEGAFLQGWNADAQGAINPNGPLGQIAVPAGQLMPPAATTQIVLTGNVDPGNTGFVTEIETFDANGVASTTTVTFANGAWTSSNGLAVDASAVTTYAGETTAAATSQDGNAAGSLQAFTIGPDGVLTGVFSNGLKQALGQVALGSFTNPAGLEKAGGSLYRTSVNSGNAQIGAAGEGGRGTLAGGTLEMSNVDLAQEFTNLIVAQRGFQANSRVITTSDELLQELVNLKR